MHRHIRIENFINLLLLTGIQEENVKNQNTNNKI